MMIQKLLKTLNYIHYTTQRRTNNSFLAPRNTHSLTESYDKIFQVTFHKMKPLCQNFCMIKFQKVNCVEGVKEKETSNSPHYSFLQTSKPFLKKQNSWYLQSLCLVILFNSLAFGTHLCKTSQSGTF